MNNMAINAINEIGQNKNDAASNAVIDNIFSELKGAYPAWRQSWSTEEDIIIAKRSWKQTLMDSNVKGLESIQRGLKRCREDAGVLVPSAGQFVKWCDERPNEILDRHGKPLLSAIEAYGKSFETKVYFGSSSHQICDQEMITRFVITLCGGDATYRGMTAEASRRAFLSNYEAGIKRWKEVYEESLSRNETLNMYFNPLVERPKAIEAPTQRLLEAPTTEDTANTVTPLTPYEQFKVDVELCKKQRPRDFGKQFRHLIPVEHVAKIREISDFATKGTLGASCKLPPIDPKFYPKGAPEPSKFDLKDPELYARHQALRELAAQRVAQERITPQQPAQLTQEQEPQANRETAGCNEYQDWIGYSNPQPPQANQLAEGCNTPQELTQLPENPVIWEENIEGEWQPLALPSNQEPIQGEGCVLTPNEIASYESMLSEYSQEECVLGDLRYLGEEFEAA